MTTSFVITCGRRVSTTSCGAMFECYGWKRPSYKPSGFPNDALLATPAVVDASTGPAQIDYTPAVRYSWGRVTRSTMDDAAKPHYSITGELVGYGGAIPRSLGYLMGYMGAPSGGIYGRNWANGSNDDAALHGYHAPLTVIAEATEIQRYRERTRAFGLPSVLIGSGIVRATSRASAVAEAMVGDIETAYDAARDARLAYIAAVRSRATLSVQGALQATARSTRSALSVLQGEYVFNVCDVLRAWLETNLP